MRQVLLGAFAGAASLAATACPAQSFNVDLDVFFGGRGVGVGVPQQSFGGAAEQPGVWNQVTVPGASTENPQLSTGPLPADWQFRRGITHTIHQVTVAGRLEIRTTGEFPYAYINGFQIVKVK